MESFKKHYLNLSSKKLIEIIEYKENYQREVIEFCLEELNLKEITIEKKREIAITTLIEKFYTYFRKNRHKPNFKLSLRSPFLNLKEVQECLKIAKDRYEGKTNAMNQNLPIG